MSPCSPTSAAFARSIRRAAAGLLAGMLLVVAVDTRADAQPAAIRYVYDDLNRLSAVVDQQGDVAVYTYDGVGNVLRIERFDVSGLPGSVAISYFTPAIGPAGTTVQVFGKGFGATPGETTLTFNGAPALVTTAAPNRLVVSVPAGAVTGPLAVTAPLGSAVSAAPFVVLGTLAVTPALTDVQVGLARQFHATEDGAPASRVGWSVNGLPGGEASVGTISATGLYTAPGVVPAPPTVTITATHEQGASLSASAQAVVLEAGPRFAAASALALALAAPPALVDRSIAATVAVQVAPPPAPALATAALASLALAPSAPAVHATARPASLGVEPVIAALSPALGAAGSVFTLTLTGAGLTGATGITFLRDDVPDTTISAGPLTPSADGASLTAEITIGAGSLPGGRVVRVTAAGAASTAAPTGGNVFSVQ